ncbi:hypothetical protein SASPL_135363 [Salvia splendens]|uniref:Uncharacterized protein n=1 Tax=Salvia splendens TaxID=180675 RepID=A0A8X8WY10_SALSN|nr:hypothetical protein SASPL_135363 [Salvia splendens]
MGDTLVSRRSEANFSIGRFYASIGEEGRFVFNTTRIWESDWFLRGGASSLACVRVHEQRNACRLSFRGSEGELEPEDSNRNGDCEGARGDIGFWVGQASDDELEQDADQYPRHQRCRKIVEEGLEYGDGENPILTDWAWDCFVGGRLDALVRNEEDA